MPFINLSVVVGKFIHYDRIFKNVLDNDSEFRETVKKDFNVEHGRVSWDKFYDFINSGAYEDSKKWTEEENKEMTEIYHEWVPRLAFREWTVSPKNKDKNNDKNEDANKENEDRNEDENDSEDENIIEILPLHDNTYIVGIVVQIIRTKSDEHFVLDILEINKEINRLTRDVHIGEEAKVYIIPAL
jgi:hypothetical protein